MINSISSALSALIGWFGDIVEALFTEAGTGTAAGALNPLLPAIGIAVALFIVTAGVRLIKNIIKGY